MNERGSLSSSSLAYCITIELPLRGKKSLDEVQLKPAAAAVPRCALLSLMPVLHLQPSRHVEGMQVVAENGEGRLGGGERMAMVEEEEERERDCVREQKHCGLLLSLVLL